MSRTGYLSWYTEDESIHPVDLLRRLPEAIGCDQALFVARTNRIATHPDDDFYLETVAEDCPARKLSSLYKPGTSLHVDADDAKLGSVIEAIVKRAIPPEILGDFLPCRPFFIVGKHFIYDGVEEEVIARPTAMVGCWGYETPLDGKRCKELIIANKEIHAEKVKLQHLMGKLKTAMYWYI